MRYYRLTMNTSNPSADKSGNFKSKAEAEKVRATWEKIVEKDNNLPDRQQYYGKTEFFVEEMEIDFGEESFS